MKSYISTSDVARAANVHPNTVRLYETWGLIPIAERSPKGYRRFMPFHIDQMKLARLAMKDPWPGRVIRHSVVNIVKTSSAGDIIGAYEMAKIHLLLVRREQEHANRAAMVVEHWIEGRLTPEKNLVNNLSIGQTAILLDVTIDKLRNWERNGLIKIPRQQNGYRYYGGLELSRLRIIRMLRYAGYSTMAILRILSRLDHGITINVRQVLDTPTPEDDLGHATDRWLSTLNETEKRAGMILDTLEHMLEIYPNQGSLTPVSVRSEVIR